MNITTVIALCLLAAFLVLAANEYRKHFRDLQDNCQAACTDWSLYFMRLYRATFESFDRERCRIDRLLVKGSRHAAPEQIDKQAHSAARMAVIRACTDAIARYPTEIRRINQGYYTLDSKLRDSGVRT